MSNVFIKIVNALRQIDNLTRAQATGTPQQLAQKLDVSPSTVFEYILLMKTILQAPIDYCRVRKTYYYKTEGQLTMQYVNVHLGKNGGNNLN